VAAILLSPWIILFCRWSGTASGLSSAPCALRASASLRALKGLRSPKQFQNASQTRHR
jgi:hypothetical protein